MHTFTKTIGLVMAVAAASAACATTSDEPNRAAASNETATPATATAPNLPEVVTYNKHIAPLLQQQCQACHHTGGLAPFAIETYRQAKGFKNLIKAAVVSGKMPEARPIRIDTGCSDANTFAGPRRLNAEEIGLFVKWADTGAVEGDAADLPPPIAWHDPLPGEWITGTPDLDQQNAPDGFNIPPHVPRDIFRRFPYKTNYDEDKYITAVEAHPDNGMWAGAAGSFPIVHHMELWIDPTGKSLEQERHYQEMGLNDIPGPGFEGEWDFKETPLLIGMWIPGADPPAIPKGFGYKLPKGATIVVEMHYAGDRVNEFPINDRSHWGLHFSDEAVKPFTSVVTRNEEFDVPAGVANSQAKWKWTFDKPITLHGITPHMHQLGRSYKLEIERPGAADACLADVEWNFEHQNAYFLNQPINLPAGSSLKWTCEYDNTEENPRQFNHPPIDVKSGRTSRDEMCQLTMHWTDQEPEVATPKR